MTILDILDWLKCFDYESQDPADAADVLCELAAFRPASPAQAELVAELRACCLVTLDN